MITSRTACLLAFVLLTVPACDSGDSTEAGLRPPSFLSSEPLAANDSRLVATVAAFNAGLDDVVAIHALRMAPADPALNALVTVEDQTGEAISLVQSVLVTATGQPSSYAVFYNPASRLSHVGGISVERSIVYIDAQSNLISIRFDPSLRYTGTDFEAGTEPGLFTAAEVTQVARAFQENPDLIKRWVVDETGSTVWQVMTLLFPQAAGKDAALFGPGVDFGFPEPFIPELRDYMEPRRHSVPGSFLIKCFAAYVPCQLV